MRPFLRALLALFPADYREEFGTDMREQIDRDYARARSRGLGSALGFGLLTAMDLLRAALGERWNPTWVGHPGGRVGERTVVRTSGPGGESMMMGWVRDLHGAWRALRRAPAFAAMTAGTLGAAIGAAAVIFTVVDAVLLDPLPFPDADRLVYIAASAPGSDLPDEFSVSSEFYLGYRRATDVLEDVSTFNSFTSTLRVGDRVERVRMSMPTPSLFGTLGAAPVLGRLPGPEDDERTAVLSHAAWIDWFGADPDVIGRAYSMGGDTRTVIGVVGPEFRFPADGTLLWIPSPIEGEGVTPGLFTQSLVGRLAPGVDAEVARARLATIAGRLPEEFGGSASYARLMAAHVPVVRPLREELLGDVQGPIWVMFAATAIVLLIACANVANLFLVRALRRRRAVAVRRAIGAGQGRIVRAQIAESVLVALAAGALALITAWVGLPALLGAAPDGLPRVEEIALSGSTVAFVALASLLSSLACGLAPALASTSATLGTLRDGTRGSTKRRHWGRDGLVVAQTALALVLLVGSGLLMRSFRALNDVDPGYDTADIFTFQLGLESEDELVDGVTYARFHLDFMARIAALPGVESVGIVDNVPLNEGVQSVRFSTEESVADPDGGVLLGRTWAAGDYFETMGIELLAGRGFEERDQTTTLGNVVVSRAAADMLWPGQNPIGRRLQWPALGTWETVIGVVEDVMQYSFRDEVQPLVYFPLVAQSLDAFVLSSPAYVVRTGRAAEIAPEVRALAREAAPVSPMYRIFTMSELAEDSMASLSFIMLTLGVAAVVALLLGTIGLYGVLSYVVAERTREIGVRIALGAEADRVRRMVVRQGVGVVAVGILIGAVTAASSTRALATLLFGIEALDPLTFVVVSLTMVVVGMLASYVPARRASNVDPVESFRGG